MDVLESWCGEDPLVTMSPAQTCIGGRLEFYAELFAAISMYEFISELWGILMYNRATLYY